jgi:hypothetical protein
MSQGFDPIKAEAQARLYDRWLYDVEEKQRIERAAHAIGYGLNPYEHARPFPRPIPTAFAGEASAASKGAAKVLPIAAALLLGGGTIGAGVVGLASLLGGSGQSGTANAALTPAEYEVIFESDGKQLRVEKAKE